MRVAERGAAPVMTLTWLGALALSGCHPHKAVRVEDVEAGPVAVPATFGVAPEGDAVALPERWWTAFDDPVLNELMIRVIEANLDLRQAWARLQQAQAIAEQIEALRWPSLDVQASATRSRGFAPVVPAGPPGGPAGEPTDGAEPTGPGVGTATAGVQAVTTNNFRVGLAASYEVDVWGRAADLAEAADLEAVATRFDVESLAMTLSAQVAETWFSLVEQRAQLDLLESQVDASRTLLELVETRFGFGLATAVDVLQQREQLLSLRAQLPPVRAAIERLEHQLAVLVGVPPAMGRELAPERDTLPEPPPIPELGLPAELLFRRPDVQAARLRVAAADHRISAAIAERLPTFRIQGSTGFGADSLTDLFDQWIWSITGSLVAPLFDGGRRVAQVEERRAELQQRLANLGQTFLVALREVEDALVSELGQARRVQALEAQVATARQLLTEARVRYAEGLSDYLPVLNAVQALQAAERELLSARRQLLTNRIQLYRALGGDWMRELEPPEPLETPGGDDPVDEVAAADEEAPPEE